MHTDANYVIYGYVNLSGGTVCFWDTSLFNPNDKEARLIQAVQYLEDRHRTINILEARKGCKATDFILGFNIVPHATHSVARVADDVIVPCGVAFAFRIAII